LNLPARQSSQHSRVVILLKKEVHIPADFSQPYLQIDFAVPNQARGVGVRFSHERSKSFPWIYPSIFDPDGFRGSQLKYIREGIAEYHLWVSETASARGCIPGKIAPGNWYVQLDITQLKSDSSGQIEIYYMTDSPEGTAPLPFFDTRVVKNTPGWYRGELHAHTIESDGVLTADELIKAAHAAKLDFLAITDHFTTSQWWRIDESRLPAMVVLNSCEITSQNGHANMHGLNEWVDVYVDRSEWSPDQAADQVHEQDGLFCINHVMSSLLGWRHFSFDWSKADLFEILHSLEGANNIPQISFWDTLLREGHRLIGVAGTDCHNPSNEIETLGALTTWVYADQLSQPGILAGLKRGNVFATRGPTLEFSAENARGESCQMGGTLRNHNRPIDFNMVVEAHEPVRVTLIKNGLFLHSETLADAGSGKQSIKFTDRNPVSGYYRFEVHQVKNNPAYRGIEWRDFSTIRALSNPIWVK